MTLALAPLTCEYYDMRGSLPIGIWPLYHYDCCLNGRQLLEEVSCHSGISVIISTYMAPPLLRLLLQFSLWCRNVRLSYDAFEA